MRAPNPIMDDLLQIIDRTETTREVIESVTRFLQEWSACQAVSAGFRVSLA